MLSSTQGRIGAWAVLPDDLVDRSSLSWQLINVVVNLGRIRPWVVLPDDLVDRLSLSWQLINVVVNPQLDPLQFGLHVPRQISLIPWLLGAYFSSYLPFMDRNTFLKICTIGFGSNCTLLLLLHQNFKNKNEDFKNPTHLFQLRIW